MDYQTKLELNQQHCTVTLAGNSPLTELSFGVEIVASHYLGRKVSRFECKRSKLDNGDCRLEFTALQPSGPIVISKVMNVRDAVSQGFYPRDISESFLNESAFSAMAQDGQHRHRGFTSKSDNLTTSVVESDTNPNTTLALLSFGLGDMFTGLFALSVKDVKWQGSVKKTQLYFKHNLSDQIVKEFLTSRQDYDLNRKIKTLT